MAKLGDLVVHIGANTTALNASLGKVQRNMRSMTANFTKLGMSMSRAITLPLALIGGSALRTAVKFEASMAKVKAISGATAQEFDSLTASAKELGRTTVFTASEVAGLQLEFAKLGFTATQINQVTEATLNLAQATGSDLAQAAEVAGATLGGFGLAASETGRVADVMAASFSTSALDINHFQESMKLVAPNAKAAGVSIEETTAMLAVLSKAGIKGSIAGTALRRILQEMQGTSGTLTERFAELNKAGLDVQGSMDEVGRRAGTSLLVLAEGSGEVQELTGAYINSAGAAKAMADVMNNTTAGAMKRMTSALEGAAFVIGDALAPALNSVATFVTDLASDFSNLSKSTQKNILIVAGLVAALGPLLIILPTLISALPLIAGAFAAMTGPIGLAVIGIGALGLVINKFVSGSSGIPDTLKKANEAVKDHTTEVRYLVGQYKDEGKSLEDRKKILKRLQDIDSTHFSNLTAENTTYKDLVKNLDDYTASLRKSYIEKSFAAEGQSLFSQLAADEKAIRAHEVMVQRMKDVLEDSNSFTRAASQANLDQELFYLSQANAVRDQTLISIENFEKRKGEILDKYATTKEDIKDKLKELEATGDTDEAIIVTPDPEEIKVINRDQMELIEALPTVLIGLEQPLKTLQRSTTTVADGIVKDLQSIIDAGWEFADGINDAISSGVASMLSGMAEMVGAAVGAEKPIENMGAFMGEMLAQMAINIGQYAIAHGTVIEAIKQSLTSLNGIAAIVAGAALIALGAGMKSAIQKNAESAGIPALAEGGLAYGPTLAMVGDNKGANVDPEIIAPLSKLKDMLGGNSIQVYGRISGDDIVISNTRASRDRNRF
jgi:phage-related minor tail protein